MIFGTIDTDKVPEAAEFCDVDPESAKLELRLITKGGTRCVQHFDSEPLVVFSVLVIIRLTSLRKVQGRSLRRAMSSSSISLFTIK